MENIKERIKIKEIYNNPEKFAGEKINVAGWARNLRSSANIGFIELNDGSYFKGLQVVFESAKIDNYAEIEAQNTGASFIISGELILTPNAKQPFELNANSIILEGASTPEYPFTKRHSPEYLREIAHLRPRTNLYSAVFKVRSVTAFAVHKFFNERNFVYIHTPIITASDCEGAGEMFQVTTLDLNNLNNNKIDYSKDFFGKKTSLTVSGQLNVECFAMVYGSVYTFGPTFRAEASNTQRHAAEFWMIEPEIAFADLSDDIDLARDCLVSVTKYVMQECAAELEFLNAFVDKGLLDKLNKIVNADFARISYTEAINLLEKEANKSGGHKFEYLPKWGGDIATEHEKFLSENIFKGPVFVTDYPAEIKSFYMRQNEPDEFGRLTVAATDLLVPGVGELIGGSQREERYDVLIEALRKNNLREEDYGWYLDLRKYGGAKHAGFGIGFERLVMYLTGVSNIRDVCAFPRTSGNAEY